MYTRRRATARLLSTSLGLCLAVVTVFMLVNLGCKQLGTNGWLTPALAAWLPLMIFAPIASAASDTLRQ